VRAVCGRRHHGGRQATRSRRSPFDALNTRRRSTLIDASAALSEWIALAKPLLAGYPRALALLFTLPLFPQQSFPLLVRNGIAIAMLAGAYPMLAAQMPPSSWSAVEWIGYTLKESFIGFVIGYAVGALFWAMESAGALIDNQAGLNNANIFDPFGGHQGGPYAAFSMQAACLLFVLLGGLPLLAALLYESFTLWPMRSFVPAPGEAYKSLALSGFQSNAAWAVRLVAPVLIVLVVVELGIGLVNRVASELNAFYFAIPIKAATAALMVAVLLSFWVDALRDGMRELSQVLPPWNAVWR
jgi:type III secretion protein T